MYWWGAEAAPLSACAYADAIAELSSARGGASDPRGTDGCRDVFIATDDGEAVREFAMCEAVVRGGWRVRAWATDEEPARGANRSVLFRLWAELTLLVRARRVPCPRRPPPRAALPPMPLLWHMNCSPLQMGRRLLLEQHRQARSAPAGAACRFAPLCGHQAERVRASQLAWHITGAHERRHEAE